MLDWELLMKKVILKSIVGGSLLAGVATAGEVTPAAVTPAVDSSISTDLGVGYHNAYIFRGIDSGTDLVDIALNASGTCPLTGLDLSAGAWYGSVKEGFGIGNYDELDLTVGASKDLGFATASVGYIFYHFFDDADDAQEVYFGLSREFYGIEAGVKYFWDVETDNQGYSEFSLAKSFDVAGFGLDVSSTLGYLVEEGALSHLTTKVSHDIKLSETATLTPYVACSVELDDLEQYIGSSEKNELFGGISLTVSF